METEYKVGDKVEIKQWVQLKKLGTINTSGDIKFSNGYHFFSTDKQCCGKIFTITDIYPTTKGNLYQLANSEYYLSMLYSDDVFTLCNNITNRQWLSSLSDEEFVKYLKLSEEYDDITCKLQWLKAIHND